MALGLRKFLFLLMLLSAGLAHASLPFDGAPRASDEELDRMRGGYIVNLNGLEFLLAFSLERLTFVNGQLVSSVALNPYSLTPLANLSQGSAATAPPPQPQTPPVSAASPPPGLPPIPALPVSANTETTSAGSQSGGGSVVVVETPPPRALTVDSPGSSPPAGPTGGGSGTGGSTQTQTAQTAGGETVPAAQPSVQVASQGGLTFVQNGPGNSFTFPAQFDANTVATIVQNSLNDQVIRTITTLNITIASQLGAARAQMDSLINQSLSRLR